MKEKRQAVVRAIDKLITAHLNHATTRVGFAFDPPHAAWRVKQAEALRAIAVASERLETALDRLIP